MSASPAPLVGGLRRGATRLRSARRLSLRRIHEAAVDLLVRLFHAPKVATETVLVELLPRLPIPEAARVGRDLVAEVAPAAGPAELELEVHQDEPAPQHVGPEDAVDPQRHTPD